MELKVPDVSAVRDIHHLSHENSKNGIERTTYQNTGRHSLSTGIQEFQEWN